MYKNAIWDRTLPHLHINCGLHVCRRVQGSQIFKRNSIILIGSKVMAFLVILLSPWSPWSPRCPHHPHVIPVIPTSSPSSPCLPRVIPIAPRRSQCGPHGCGLRGLHPMLSPWSLHRPHHAHVVPTSSRRFPHHPQPPDTHSTHPHPLGGGGP